MIFHANMRHQTKRLPDQTKIFHPQTPLGACLCVHGRIKKKLGSFFGKSPLSLGLSPLPVTVANEGLVRDPLLKMVHNPVGDCYWEGGQPKLSHIDSVKKKNSQHIASNFERNRVPRRIKLIHPFLRNMSWSKNEATKTSLNRE